MVSTPSAIRKITQGRSCYTLVVGHLNLIEMASTKNIDPNVLKAFSEAMQAPFAKFKKSLEPVTEILQDFANSFKEAPQSLKDLAGQGWYLPFDFHPPTINYCAEELRKGNHKTIDDKMVKIIDEEISNIEKDLVEKFPTRKAPIQAAIKAHMAKDYYLSIPVFFSQAEGICVELTEYRFFSIKNGRPATATWIQNVRRDSIMELVLEPLKHPGVARQKQNSNNPLGINRHDVLHGASVDYGEDKINSYKAFSLLNYIGETVYLAKQEVEKKEKEENAPQHEAINYGRSEGS